MPGSPIGELLTGEELPAAPTATIATYGRGAPGVPEGEAITSAVDGEILARLTALGYIDGGTPVTVPETGSGGGSIGTVTGHLNSGNARLARGDYAGAEPEYRAALDLAPRYVPAHLGLAQCLIATGRREEGWEEIRSSLHDGPELDPGIYMKVARFYYQEREYARGAELFGELPVREDLEAARLISSGILLVAAGDERAGEAALREGLRLEPGFPEGIQEMYNILTRRGTLDDLVILLEAAMEARPGTSPPANLLALTHEKAGREARAVAVLEAALEGSPRNLATLVNLAGLRIRMGNAREALPLLRRAVAIDPAHLESLVNLVVAQGRLGDLEGARETFRAAGRQTSRIELMNAMGYALYLNGSLQEAREIIEHSLQRDPDQDETRRLLDAIDEATGSPTAPAPAGGPGL
jgi:tetratricopeptide (TPR) repeat protein